ncbi:hypothetical protein J8L70_05520 [Pseudoalteromonas sp. MMG010]|uniref:hypothetical protein n=1 Tax=Pseudoalteromonas sp. MMG010 TaxID=2822685 RepID=UPI001B3A3FA4|nr:hypothetical protein [Pseudoalteromonas sp. MMG010]MBQ4832695.1 hypothetical protein [Pseudoalteromonas sp. MMG010]
MNIKTALAEFVGFGDNKETAIGVIAATPSYGQDINYSVTTQEVIKVLERVVNNEIPLDDLLLWANVIESRDDIACGESEGVIYALSNDDQMGELTIAKLVQILHLLNNTPD